MGLVNFYRRFIKGFATISKPLTDLTKKAIEFKWEATEEAAFEALKKALTTAPILQVFDEEKPHEVWVDASDYAVGATLVQPSDDGKTWLPVEYLSHRLSLAEQNYNATNREFVTILSALKHWRHYLLRAHFIVRSDHASLRWLQSQPQLSRRQVRTLEFCS